MRDGLGVSGSLLVSGSAPERRPDHMNQNLIPLACAAVMTAAVNTGLFDSLCSVSAPAKASGAITGTYTAVTGLQSIPCMDAPDNFGAGISATEVKALDETASMALRHVLLNAYYSLLSPT